MAIITDDEVARMALLARLGLTAAEQHDAARKLGTVLDHFTAIQSVDTTAAVPTDAMSGQHNVKRTDTVEHELCEPTALLEAAPATLRAHIQVKAVF